jgi:catechol 2,3-dioxygenase-like lactoylglutathione lyase family enzyme
MPALAFNHFNLRADSAAIKKLRDFYVDVVGMTEGWRPPFPFPGHWLYLGDQAVLHLVVDETAKPPSKEPSSTFDHVAFTCTDLAEFEQRLRSGGLEYRRVLVTGTTQIQLVVSDPSGNGVELNFDSGAA